MIAATGSPAPRRGSHGSRGSSGCNGQPVYAESDVDESPLRLTTNRNDLKALEQDTMKVMVSPTYNSDQSYTEDTGGVSFESDMLANGVSIDEVSKRAPGLMPTFLAMREAEKAKPGPGKFKSSQDAINLATRGIIYESDEDAEFRLRVEELPPPVSSNNSRPSTANTTKSWAESQRSHRSQNSYLGGRSPSEYQPHRRGPDEYRPFQFDGYNPPEFRPTSNYPGPASNYGGGPASNFGGPASNYGVTASTFGGPASSYGGVPVGPNASSYTGGPGFGPAPGSYAGAPSFAGPGFAGPGQYANEPTINYRVEIDHANVPRAPAAMAGGMRTNKYAHPQDNRGSHATTPSGRPLFSSYGPVDSRLSPTAAEFNTQPWNPSHLGKHVFLQHMHPVNWRHLLEPGVTADWNLVVDKIISHNDQQASIFLQQKIKNSDNVIKDDIIHAIINRGLELMGNRFGNFLIQRVFECASEAQIMGLAGHIRCHTVRLSTDAFGCHVVQKAFDCVPEEFKFVMVAELLTRIADTVVHRYACHVWQKLFELRWAGSPPMIMGTVNKALRGNWTQVALGETGSLVVQNIFENCNETDKRPCVDEVLHNLHIIARGQFGNWCIQHICEHGSPNDRDTAIEMILRCAADYSMDQYASKVIEKCLKVCGTEFLAQYLTEVLVKRPDDNQSPLVQIARDQYGNFLVQWIINNAEPHMREVVQAEIRKHLVSLRGNKYGSKVALSCGYGPQGVRPGVPFAPSHHRNSFTGHRDSFPPPRDAFPSYRDAYAPPRGPLPHAQASITQHSSSYQPCWSQVDGPAPSYYGPRQSYGYNPNSFY